MASLKRLQRLEHERGKVQSVLQACDVTQQDTLQLIHAQLLAIVESSLCTANERVNAGEVLLELNKLNDDSDSGELLNVSKAMRESAGIPLDAVPTSPKTPRYPAPPDETENALADTLTQTLRSKTASIRERISAARVMLVNNLVRDSNYDDVLYFSNTMTLLREQHGD